MKLILSQQERLEKTVLRSQLRSDIKTLDGQSVEHRILVAQYALTLDMGTSLARLLCLTHSQMIQVRDKNLYSTAILKPIVSVYNNLYA